MESNREEKKQAHRSAFFILCINLLLMCLVAIGAIAGVWYWLDDFTRHGEGIDVPDVKGRMVSDATYTLGLMDLSAVVVDSSYNEHLNPGVVLAQVPDVGCRVKSGREIFLTVNAANSPTMPMPDLADNCSRREAEYKLANAGFKRVVVVEVPGDKDWVMAVKCEGMLVPVGERVPLDATITVEVGNGSLGTYGNEVDSIAAVDDSGLGMMGVY